MRNADKPTVHHRNSAAQFTACGVDSLAQQGRYTRRRKKATCVLCQAVLMNRGLVR